MSPGPEWYIGVPLFMFMASAVTAASMHHHYSVHRARPTTRENWTVDELIANTPDTNPFRNLVSPAMTTHICEEYGEDGEMDGGGITPPAVYDQLTPEALHDAWVNEYGQ